jgi:hypothetical protein
MAKKPINMATGGLMSLPPYLRDTEKKDSGITPYDVSTPDSARKGLPQRGLSKSRTRYSKGDIAKGPVKPEQVPSIDSWEDATDDSDVIHLVKLNVAEKSVYKKLKAMDESGVLDKKGKEKLKKLEQKKNKSALGGYMDNFQISQEEPLAKFSIGGQAALDEKYDRRKDYQAYAEGDEVIAEEEIIDEPLMAPPGMDLAEEDAIAETDIELAAEEEVR